MNKVVCMIGVSLDGFIEGPGRDISWHRVDEELHAYFNELLAGMGAFLHGRVTYELMADFWPTADQDPENPPVMVEFAGIWLNMRKVVYSRTLPEAEWNTTIARDVVPEEVEALKREVDGDLVVGGPNLLASFLAHDLVDEFRVSVHPVVIGGGTPLFPLGVSLDLDLVETRAFGNGVVMLRYEVRRSTRSDPTARTSSN